MNGYLDFSILKGKTLVSVRNIDNDELIFETDKQEKYVLHHDQECCENVYIADICGDLTDLIGAPILIADESIMDNENPKDVDEKFLHYQEDEDCFAWTFYRLGTIKGDVVIRWYGTSNGYYAIGVDFEIYDRDKWEEYINMKDN
jgi:hypothetical protein